MPGFLSIIVMCLLLGATSIHAAGQQAPAKPEELSPKDREVVAVMEILQLMDLAEELDMIKDINYLIEEDQNGDQTD